jgi:hypothetical protein
MMSGIPARVIQVLQDYLPAELDLIDTEEGDSVTTPDIDNADYHQWDRLTIAEYPACSLRTVSSTLVDIKPETFGRRIDAFHRVDVMFHATIANAVAASTADQSMVLQKLMHRYIAGAARVLCVMYEGLQTSADATRWAETVIWTEPAVYGPEFDQTEDGGAIVRTATLPIAVRRREARG